MPTNSADDSTQETSLGAFCRVRDHFSRKPIFRDHKQHLTAYFGCTDFHEPQTCALIEDMAEAMTIAAPLSTADVIVSIADRSGGCLAQALSVRTGLPYLLANWYPQGSPGEIDLGPSAGFSGEGTVYLNGLKRGRKVAIVSDVVRSGETVRSLLRGVQQAGCVAVAVVAGCEVVEDGARATFAPLVPFVAIARIHMRAEMTKEAEGLDGKLLPATPAHQYVRPLLSSRIATIKRMTPDEVRARELRCASSFVGVPIMHNARLSYPYSFFLLTDFIAPMEPSFIEDLADLCVFYGDFERCDVIVSECDRGGAPMAQAVAARVNKPYVLANWYPSAGGASSDVQIGFSGHGNIVVNGVRPGDRCVIIDDMLSSGGTAEGLLRSIVKLGGIPSQAIFASEKLYPPLRAGGLPNRKGYLRLKDPFPYVEIVTLCQFIADGDMTKAPAVVVGDESLLSASSM